VESGVEVDATPQEQAAFEAADKEFADELFGRAARDVLPGVAPGLVGLLLAALLAAVMSSSDAQMVVSSGLFTENIYRRFLARGRSQRHYLWAGRLSGLVIVALALILQTTFQDVVHALEVIIKTPAAIGLSLWIGVTWRGWTPIAVWVSSIAAYVTWGLLAYFPNYVAEIPMLNFMLVASPADAGTFKVTDAWTMCAYLSVGMLAGLAVSFFTPRTPKEKLDRFFILLRTPVVDGEVVTAPCTLPEDHAQPIAKLIDHSDFEIPRPNRVDVLGFLGAWMLVGLIVLFTWWVSRA
jgi:Na+/proline symporter